MPDLSNLFHLLLHGDPAPSEPQAYTRTTRTPMSWASGMEPSNDYAQFYPQSQRIVVNADKFPQANPALDPNDTEGLPRVLRHEQVHAIMTPQIIDGIMAYFKNHPALNTKAQQGLAVRDPGAAADPRRMATEMPAYAVQGENFGLPPAVLNAYIARMPAPIRSKYLELLRRGGR